MFFYDICAVDHLNFANVVYRGVDRGGPLPDNTKDERLIKLWQRYADYWYDQSREMDLEEIRYLAEKLAESNNEEYEIILVSDNKEESERENFYGIDVAGGYHSMLPAGFNENSGDAFCRVINFYLKAKLNENGLFYDQSDAELFREVLIEYKKILPGYIEDEEWRLYYIYKALKMKGGKYTANNIHRSQVG